MTNLIQSYSYAPSTANTPAQRLRPSEENVKVIQAELVDDKPSQRPPSSMADYYRRVEAQAEAKSVLLQPQRTPDELPLRNQEALAAYLGTLSASRNLDGGELVGLDVYA
jgi:hypothetical protein